MGFKCFFNLSWQRTSFQLKKPAFTLRIWKLVRSFYNVLLGLTVIRYLKDKHIFFRGPIVYQSRADSGLKSSPSGHFGERKIHFAFEPKPGNDESQKTKIEGLESLLLTR